jgi:signal transduction histidine kinase
MHHDPPPHPSALIASANTVDDARAALLFRNAMPANLTVVAVSLLVAGVLSTVNPLPLTLGWLLAMGIASALRLSLMYDYRHRRDSRSATDWVHAYVSRSVLVGVIWAGVPGLLMPDDSLQHQFLVIVLVFGLASSAISVLNVSLLGMILYLMPSLVTLAIRLFMIDWLYDSTYTLLSVALMAIYPVLHIAVARGTNRAIIDSLRLREENHELLDRLREEVAERRSAQTALEAHREELQAQVAAQVIELREANQRLSREVAERRLAQLEAENAQQAAEHANQAKSEFLANISHELRTPMHAVLSFAELGEDRADKLDRDKLRSYFNRINGSGQRLLGLLNDLLDLSKLEAGRVELKLEPLPVNRLLRNVAEEMSALASGKLVTLALPQNGDSPLLQADEARLHQVLRNLLGNALRYAPEGSSVTLNWQRVTNRSGEARIEISVADRGPGIPEKELKSIFDKFVQSSLTKTGAGGTGLGLAISKEIVELHGGSIRARNRAGGGARFMLQIPCHQPG